MAPWLIRLTQYARKNPQCHPWILRVIGHLHAYGVSKFLVCTRSPTPLQIMAFFNDIESSADRLLYCDPVSGDAITGEFNRKAFSELRVLKALVRKPGYHGKVTQQAYVADYPFWVLFDQSGKLTGMPVNTLPTALFRQGEPFYGPVLLISSKFKWSRSGQPTK